MSSCTPTCDFHFFYSIRIWFDSLRVPVLLTRPHNTGLLRESNSEKPFLECSLKTFFSFCSLYGCSRYDHALLSVFRLTEEGFKLETVPECCVIQDPFVTLVDLLGFLIYVESVALNILTTGTLCCLYCGGAGMKILRVNDSVLYCNTAAAALILVAVAIGYIISYRQNCCFNLSNVRLGTKELPRFQVYI